MGTDTTAIPADVCRLATRMWAHKRRKGAQPYTDAVNSEYAALEYVYGRERLDEWLRAVREEKS